MTFSILTVCTGNICRSPLAELALSHDLAGLPGVVVSSAGVGALVGAGVPEAAQQLAAASGLDASAHRARQIDTSNLRAPDLILAMAREHRRTIVQLQPGSMRRTFTIRELARIAKQVQPHLEAAVTEAAAVTAEECMRVAVQLASSLRGTVPPPPDPAEFDVVDPYKQAREVYVRSFDELMPAAKRVASYLTLAASLARAA